MMIKSFLVIILQTQLVSNIDIWADSVYVAILKRKHRKDPIGLFRAMIKLLVSEKRLASSCISATGKRGCVRIPRRIISAAISKYRIVCKINVLYERRRILSLCFHTVVDS